MIKIESILITGGGGMLAHALDRALQSRGKSAVAIARAGKSNGFAKPLEQVLDGLPVAPDDCSPSWVVPRPRM